MRRIVKNTVLNYLPADFKIEKRVNSKRIFKVNDISIKKGYVIYLCEREIRAKDNFALQFALLKSKELNLPLKIIHPKIHYKHLSKQNFIDKQVMQAKNVFCHLDLDFQIIDQEPEIFLKNFDIATLIIDFNPILKRNYLKNIPSAIYEVDGHNIIPARFVSNKQEYSAATLRRKIYYNIYPFFTEYDNLMNEKVEADNVLEDFINNKLPYYAEFKNDPSKNVLSGLSKYLNLGFIASQRVALNVVKSNADQKNKEAFLEELIVRKELADNFCLYAENFKDFTNIPNWAKFSLNKHDNDLRSYVYTCEELEKAKTHDKLWNVAQMQLLSKGTIHGYLRMYWAKKILEWTYSHKKALEIAIYLNDKYAYDSPSPNGYVGILWALGGLHDRAFVDYPVTGKIRRMTYNSLKKKYNLDDYINDFI